MIDQCNAKKKIDPKYWEEGRGRWNGHRAFDTIAHHHVSCYFPAAPMDSCDLMVVQCADGRWYVEDNWGGDAKGAEKVWNPFDREEGEPCFLSSKDEALGLAVSVVASMCGVPEDTVSII